MSLRVPQQVLVGFAPVFTAAQVGGDSYPNSDGKTFFAVKNGDAAPVNVTVQVQKAGIKFAGAGTVDFEDIVFPVPAGAERWITVPKLPYNDVNEQVQITYSAVANVTVAAFVLPTY